jgi:hypothetical protein
MQSLARLLGALAIAAGATFLTYGAANTGAEVSKDVPEPAAMVAMGVGLLVGGLLAIVLFGAKRPQQGD